MKNFLLIFISTITFLTVFERIIPKGKTGKIVKAIFSCFIVFIILNPVVKIFSNEDNFYDEIPVNLELSNYLENYKIQTLKKEIEVVLESQNYCVQSCNINKVDEKYIVQIILNKSCINENDEHIFSIDKAKKLIIDRLYLDDWEIVVNFEEN